MPETASASGTERRIRIDVDGVRLAVREWPGPTGAPSLLLLHGLASSSHIFDLVAPQLTSRFRLVAFDQRGHGESSKPSTGYGFDRVAGDALAVIRRLRLDPTLVLGHSWGASVALHVAAAPRTPVTGAILLDGGFVGMRDRMDWRTTKERLSPPPLGGMHADEFLAMGRRLFEGVLEPTPEIEAVFLSLMRVDRAGRIRPRLSLRNHLRILRAMWEHDPIEVLRRVRVPTLVLAVRSGRPEEAEFYAAKRKAASRVRAIGEPVRFRWIDGIHDLPLQRPGALAARVVRFANEIGLVR